MLALAGIAAIFSRCRDDPAGACSALDHHGFARTALAATSLETIHFGEIIDFGPEYCRRALSPEEGGEWGDGNERTGDEASSRRERSETADGRRNPGHGKGSGSRREDSLQGRGGHNRDRIHLALQRVLMIRVARQAPADVRFALLRGQSDANGTQRRDGILRRTVAFGAKRTFKDAGLRW